MAILQSTNLKTKMVVKDIEPWVITFLGANNLKVLRRKKDGMALNVSYTEDGLKWTSNKVGRALYYKDGVIKEGKIVSSMEKSNEVYVEKFVPSNRKTAHAQSAECLWIHKAMKLLYTVDSPRPSKTEVII